jgi:sugar-specific transcriptional regulator TrmB
VQYNIIVLELPVLMLEDKKYIQTLTELGLTILQAKIYVTLTKLGKADARTISKQSNVVREEIYRIMPELEKIGLAEKTLTRPTLYKATLLKDGLGILIQRKAEETCRLQKKTRNIIQNLKGESFRRNSNEENLGFIITSEKLLFRKRFETNIQMTRFEINVITSGFLFRQMVFNHSKSIAKALERGVNIRVITEETEDETIPEHVRELMKNRFFKIKYLFSPSLVTMAVFDDKEVNVCISSEIVPNLWSNNPAIVKLTAGYFKQIWNQESTD